MFSAWLSAGGSMINDIYLSATLNEKIKKELQKKEFPSATLFHFLDEETYTKIQAELLRTYFRPEQLLTSHSYATAELSPTLNKLFLSPECKEFISSLLDTAAFKINARLYRFGWKDYTLVSNDSLPKLGVDIILNLTEAWNEDFGGVVRYKDTEGNFISLPAQGNVFTIVRTSDEIQQFVQYINHHAEKRKRLMVMGKIR